MGAPPAGPPPPLGQSFLPTALKAAAKATRGIIFSYILIGTARGLGCCVTSRDAGRL